VTITFWVTFGSPSIDIPASPSLPLKADLRFFLQELLHQPDYLVPVQMSNLPDHHPRRHTAGDVVLPSSLTLTPSPAKTTSLQQVTPSSITIASQALGRCADLYRGGVARRYQAAQDATSRISRIYESERLRSFNPGTDLQVTSGNRILCTPPGGGADPSSVCIRSHTRRPAHAAMAATDLRDLKALVNLGILEKKGASRRETCYIIHKNHHEVWMSSR
jgi:hypothetical protein